MEFLGNCIIYDADDEEPNCVVCNNQVFDCYCEHCGAEYGWCYYKRKEGGGLK